MAEICLEAKDLCKTYIVDGFSNNVLQNINLKIEEGEFVSIMGPSGSGKSTLLYTISGMDNMTAGKVIFDGDDLSKMSDRQLTKMRLLKMGFIFQQMYMMKKLSIMDNIVLPGYQAGLVSRDEVNKKAEDLMRKLGIIETAGREITEVSGGQLQRACLARALINSPKVLFADEPTASLDHENAYLVMDRLREYAKERLVIVITHDHSILRDTDMTVEIWDGSISDVKQGLLQETA